jgi:hypothetical protein
MLIATETSLISSSNEKNTFETITVEQIEVFRAGITKLLNTINLVKTDSIEGLQNKLADIEWKLNTCLSELNSLNQNSRNITISSMISINEGFEHNLGTAITILSIIIDSSKYTNIFSEYYKLELKQQILKLKDTRLSVFKKI